MANQRKYEKFGRNKLPRNKYGLTGDSNYSSTSFFGNQGVTGSEQQWAGQIVGDVMPTLDDFVGATQYEDGARGIVPAPLAGMHQWHYLSGNGGWEYIPAAKWFEEFPTGGGFEKTGLQLNGDLNVTDTITTMNLEVQGAAHFWSLIIDEVKASGGQVLVSPSMFYVDYVGSIYEYPLFTVDSPLRAIVDNRADISNILSTNNVTAVKCRRVYQRKDDGHKEIKNECQVGDMMRCRTFNLPKDAEDATVYEDISNVDYWTFVCAVGEETYYDGEESFLGLYIDLAYALKLTNGHTYPLGTVFKANGTTPDTPDGWTEQSSVWDLKRKSQDTLQGPDGYVPIQDEMLDALEFEEVQKKVIDIRGMDDAVDSISGRRSTQSLNANRNNLNTLGRTLAFIAGGEDELDPDVDEYTSLILYGNLSESGTGNTTHSDNELRLAKRIVDNVMTESTIDESTRNLEVNFNTGGQIVVREGRTLGAGLVAAEDLIDSTTNEVVYQQGDVIDTTETPEALGDWRVISTLPDDTLTATDNDGQTVTLTTDEQNEINNVTDTTTINTDRNTDEWVDYNYGDLDYWSFGYGKFTCEKGDSLACLGNLFDPDRQNAIVLSAFNPIDPDLEAPAIAQYTGIDIFGESISKYRVTAIAKNGNEFIGSFLINYQNKYIDVNERINMFMTDITTGLEVVGIHLDGENSTITLIGSVELKQHSNTSMDTLSVYDNLGTKRVEITPEKIPARTSPDSPISRNEKVTFTSASTSKNATSAYITKERHKHGLFGLGKSTYSYELKDFNIQHTITATLGELNYGSQLDLSNLHLIFYAKPWLFGNTNVDNRGTGKQKVTTVKYTLKCNGLNVYGQTNVELKSSNLLSVSGLDSATITFNIGSIFANDISITTSGTYSIEFTVGVNVYAYGEVYDDKDNYYYRINTGLSGDMRIGVSIPQSGTSSSDMSATKMTIGTNGFAFMGNNSRYVYAGTDGIEMKWDDARLVLDSNYGFCENKLYTKVTSSTYLTAKYEICIADSTTATIYLPAASDYGNGRTLTVIGKPGIKVKPIQSDVIQYRNETRDYYTGITFGTDTITYSVQFLNANGTWYIMSLI